MEPTPSPLSPTSYSAWDDIPTATHLSPIPVDSWEDSESMPVLPEIADLEWGSMVVPDTPEFMLDLMETDSIFTYVPETQAPELDCVGFVVPEVSATNRRGKRPVQEIDCVGSVVPEALATIRPGKRPVQEKDWVNDFLVMFLPEMADLL